MPTEEANANSMSTSFLQSLVDTFITTPFRAVEAGAHAYEGLRARSSQAARTASDAADYGALTTGILRIIQAGNPAAIVTALGQIPADLDFQEMPDLAAISTALNTARTRLTSEGYAGESSDMIKLHILIEIYHNLAPEDTLDTLVLELDDAPYAEHMQAIATDVAREAMAGIDDAGNDDADEHATPPLESKIAQAFKQLIYIYAYYIKYPQAPIDHAGFYGLLANAGVRLNCSINMLEKIQTLTPTNQKFIIGAVFLSGNAETAAANIIAMEGPIDATKLLIPEVLARLALQDADTPAQKQLLYLLLTSANVSKSTAENLLCKIQDQTATNQILVSLAVFLSGNAETAADSIVAMEGPIDATKLLIPEVLARLALQDADTPAQKQLLYLLLTSANVSKPTAEALLNKIKYLTATNQILVSLAVFLSSNPQTAADRINGMVDPIDANALLIEIGYERLLPTYCGNHEQQHIAPLNVALSRITTPRNKMVAVAGFITTSDKAAYTNALGAIANQDDPLQGPAIIQLIRNNTIKDVLPRKDQVKLVDTMAKILGILWMCLSLISGSHLYLVGATTAFNALVYSTMMTAGLYSLTHYTLSSLHEKLNPVTAPIIPAAPSPAPKKPASWGDWLSTLTVRNLMSCAPVVRWL